MRWWLGVLAMLGCGGSAPFARTEALESAPIEEPRPGWRTLAARLERAEGGGFAPFAGLVAENCPLPPAGETPDSMSDYWEQCNLPGTVARDDARGVWIILDVDYSEGGMEAWGLFEATAESDNDVLSGTSEPDEIRALSEHLAQRPALSRPENLVREVAPDQYSLNEYTPLVALGAPLDGWLVYPESSGDPDRPEDTVWLIEREGRAFHVLGRRPARTTPCDDELAYDDEGERDDEATMRAENNLCMEPLGIDAVASDGTTIVVKGTVQVAGHGGYPPWHLVAELPSALR